MWPTSTATEARGGGAARTRPGSRPCIGSTWPRCTAYAFYELRDHHDAEDATEPTFLAALANLGRFEERARPADGEGASTFRVWLFQIARNAVAERRAASAAGRRGAARGRRSSPRPTDVEAEAARRDEARAACVPSTGCPATAGGR